MMMERGHAPRAAKVEPRNAGTIAVPVFNDRSRAVASLDLTCFHSALAADNDARERCSAVLETASNEVTRDLTRLKRGTLA